MSFKCLVTKFGFVIFEKKWCIFTKLFFLWMWCHVMRKLSNIKLSFGVVLRFSPPSGIGAAYWLLPPTLEWRCPADLPPLEWCFFPTSCFWAVLLFIFLLLGGAEFLVPPFGWCCGFLLPLGRCCFSASFWVVVIFSHLWFVWLWTYENKIINWSKRHKKENVRGTEEEQHHPEKRNVRQHTLWECEHQPTEREGKNSTTSKKKMGYPSPSSQSVSDGDDRLHRSQRHRRTVSIVSIVSIVSVGREPSFRSTTPEKEGRKQPPPIRRGKKSSTTPNWEKRERLHNSLHIQFNQILKLAHNNFTKVSFYW